MFRRTAVSVGLAAALLGAVALPAAADSAPLSTRTANAPVGAAATVIDVTSQNFPEVLKMSEQRPVVLDFYADWCGPCKQMKPHLEKFHQQDGDKWVLARVNVDRNRPISQKYNIRFIPTLVNIQKGEEAGSRHEGFDGPAPLRAWLNAL
ncbi:thioredoxin family protein [Streptomyces sp. NPDC017940]|uniref:thioredoxin family protein n=1 Tax=Streptomyces sp. NPDC017940 TaxID=3365017 RepID=UPI0037A602B0